MAKGAPVGSPARLSLWGEALAAAVRAQGAREWRGSPLHLATLARPSASSWAASPRDVRPADDEAGAAILGGRFVLDGEPLVLEPGADPWTMASPSRRFAASLHRFDWAPDLAAMGEAGAREALRLALGWTRVFGRWNRFSWDLPILERRVFRLACLGKSFAEVGGGTDAAVLAQALARQARFLVETSRASPRAAEQLACAAVAGLALGGKAGERLLAAAAPRLEAVLERVVADDGGHVSRSPERALELRLDLLAVEDGYAQRGRVAPVGVSRALDRLAAAMRFFALSDGRLPALQGGETSRRAQVAAAMAEEDQGFELPAATDACAGFQRLRAPALEVVADAAAPADGRFSLTACGQPLAIEVVAGPDRLITSSAWSPRAAAPQALRFAAAASTVTIGLGDVGAPLRGFAGAALGPRLVGAIQAVEHQRRETEAGAWLDMAHAGWVRRTGLAHERRLFLDKVASELRGEDRFVPRGALRPTLIPVAVYFHIHPLTSASIARDQRSVLIKGPSGAGWWLRNDAGEVSMEAGAHLRDGRVQRSQVVVLRGRLRADRGGRLRWKLTMAEPGLTVQAPPATPDPDSA